MSAPSALTASVRQERTLSPFTRIVHAPQTPCSQPTCVPVSPMVSRMKSESSKRGSTLAAYFRPFTVTTISIFTAHVPPRASTRSRTLFRPTRRSDFYGIRLKHECRSEGLRMSARLPQIRLPLQGSLEGPATPLRHPEGAAACDFFERPAGV